jgi:hypothetical protein
VHTYRRTYYFFFFRIIIIHRRFAYECIPEGLIYVHAYLCVYHHRRGARVVRRGMARQRVSGSGTVVGRREPVGPTAGGGSGGTVPPVHTTVHTHARTSVEGSLLGRLCVVSLYARNLIWFRCRVQYYYNILFYLKFYYRFFSHSYTSIRNNARSRTH